ncbi:hypothetical protein Ssi02_57200 [Sinosporangium siamense]|uniref:Uncharacterized protein n=1 Tax=Sinosporangium siamense TaxID=1367973 RepID=A0A919RN35_9ACTN|nr:hypothetical protein Ssi02_57200 [Sinosporangium siamense]
MFVQELVEFVELLLPVDEHGGIGGEFGGWREVSAAHIDVHAPVYRMGLYGGAGQRAAYLIDRRRGVVLRVFLAPRRHGYGPSASKFDRRTHLKKPNNAYTTEQPATKAGGPPVSFPRTGHGKW